MHRRLMFAFRFGASSAVLIAMACGGTGETPAKLQSIQSGGYEAIVVKDVDGLFWAIPVVGIDSVDDTRLAIKEGTVLARGKGSGAEGMVEAEMGSQLIDLLRKSNVGGWGATSTSVEGPNYSISAEIELAEERREINVVKVVRMEK